MSDASASLIHTPARLASAGMLLLLLLDRSGDDAGAPWLLLNAAMPCDAGGEPAALGWPWERSNAALPALLLLLPAAACPPMKEGGAGGVAGAAASPGTRAPRGVLLRASRMGAAAPMRGTAPWGTLSTCSLDSTMRQIKPACRKSRDRGWASMQRAQCVCMGAAQGSKPEGGGSRCPGLHLVHGIEGHAAAQWHTSARAVLEVKHDRSGARIPCRVVQNQPPAGGGAMHQRRQQGLHRLHASVLQVIAAHASECRSGNQLILHLLAAKRILVGQVVVNACR